MRRTRLRQREGANGGLNSGNGVREGQPPKGCPEGRADPNAPFACIGYTKAHPLYGSLTEDFVPWISARHPQSRLVAPEACRFGPSLARPRLVRSDTGPASPTSRSALGLSIEFRTWPYPLRQNSIPGSAQRPTRARIPVRETRARWRGFRRPSWAPDVPCAFPPTPRPRV